MLYIWAMKFSLVFFPFCITLPTTIFDGYTHVKQIDREKERGREVVGMIKCAFKVSPKYGCLCPKTDMLRMKSAKFVFVHKCVELYIYYISMRLAIIPFLHSSSHTHIIQQQQKKKQTFAILSALHIVVNGFVCFV